MHETDPTFRHRTVHFHDPGAPVATVVIPSVFVAARNERAQLLLVRRCDSGAWELPGGRAEVGESAVETAIRETAEESGLRVRITGLAGVFTDPLHIVESADGHETRQQFVVCLHATAPCTKPSADLYETCDAAWFEPGEVAALTLEPGARLWIQHVLSAPGAPHFE
jgi:ADP-ribose pyrophosphatase YjhB (NUDIX family)